MRSIGHITKVVLLIFLMVGCDTNRFDVDVSQHQVSMEIKRLDVDFFQADVDEIERVNQQLLSEYGRFYKVFIQQVLRLGMPEDPAIAYTLKSFLTDNYVKDLSAEVQKKFPSVSTAQKQIEEAFGYYSYYFPGKKVPDLVTTISGFSANVIVTDSVLGIGLDMYLGADHEYYQKAGLPAYKLKSMNPQNIPFDAMRGWVSSEFEADAMKGDLLGIMIKYGKVLYVLDALFPKSPDHMKIGYSPEQITWCEENDFNIWTNIIESEMLYSTMPNDIRRYVGEAPFTSGMPKESPGQIGFWVGWQIVRAYMDEFPDTTLEELMNMNDAQAILQRSKYKPDN